MLKYWLWLSLLEGITRRKKVSLLKQYSGPDDIFQREDYSDLAELTEAEYRALMNKNMLRAEQVYNICRRKNISILTYGDADYPARLRNIEDPPVVLYYRGTLPELETVPAVAIVGTRRATAYGTAAAKEFGKQIAQAGGVVISGGAKGIDSMALQGALAGDGLTVAVLGCGVDITYPANNRQLFDQVRTEGCLLSEYPPGDEPEQWHFPERNRIISGLSDSVVVIEAPKRSGALITAGIALEQGRDVYAVPGNIDMETCEGSNMLLQNGAAVALSGWDVLKEPATGILPQEKKSEKKLPAEKSAPDKKGIDNPANSSYIVTTEGQDSLTPEESSILACLSQTPVAMDEVLAQLDIPAGVALKLITGLSLRGLVINHPGKMLSVKRQHK